MKKLLTVLSSFIFFASCQKEIKPITADINHTNITASLKPNVLFILIDDMGFEVPSINGGQSYQTPNIDALASDGIQFTQGHSCPLCSPSRVELLTGKYNFRNYTAWGDLSPNEKTIGNLMRDAGYATGWFGKDQLGGGGISLNSWGFDSYIVHDALGRKDRQYRYKSPHLYTHGAFLPDSLTHNKYGEDIVRDSLLSFIEDNSEIKKPFFAYYPMILCHMPFQPTPDDLDYLTFNIDESNVAYYPSMVKYCDKVIGQVISKINELGIADNTIIILTADNGTPHVTSSMFMGYEIQGGKGTTIEYGTHVPFYVKWDGHTTPHIDSSLIDFTDILATIKDISNVDTNGYGTLDGVSFYHNILNKTGINRSWIFDHFDPHPEDDEGDSKVDKFTRWVQNATYKLYDTIAYPNWKSGKFMRYADDFTEPKTLLRRKTREEKKLDSLFTHVLSDMH